MLTDTDLVAVAEASEAESARIFEVAPAASVERLGITTERIAGARVVSVRNDPHDFWSKAVGLGVSEPATASVIRRIMDFYRRQGSPRAQIFTAPALLPPDWDEIVAEHGLTVGSARFKLMCPVADFRAPRATRFRIGPVAAEDADAAAGVLLETLGMAYLADVFAHAFRTGVLHAFAAWDGDDIVGVAILRLGGPGAQFHGAATLPAYRRQGIQSGLLAARAQAAVEAGSRWLVSEVAAVVDGNQSLENMLTAGFTLRYERPSWIWTNPDY